MVEGGAVDLLLAPGGVLLDRAEVPEGAEAGDGVEGPEVRGGHLAGVAEVDVEAVPLAGLRLRRREGDADAGAFPLADEGEQCPQPQPRSRTRFPGPIPICSATYSCLCRWACSRLSEKSPSYFAPLKSANSPRLSRKIRSISE